MALKQTVGGDVVTEAKQMHPEFGSHVAGEAILTENGAVERLESGHDAFYIGPDERQELGIPDNMEPVWIRDQRYYGNKVPGDRWQEFKRTNKGGDIVKDKNGNFVVNEDLVLAMRPKALMDEYRKREQAEFEDYQKRMMQAQTSEMMDADDFDKHNRERLMAIKRANQQRFIQSGMIGPASPSQGQNMEDYIRNRGLTEDDIETESLTFARGGMSNVSIDDLKEIAAEMEGRSRGKSGGGGKTYSLPPNIRPRNLAKS